MSHSRQKMWWLHENRVTDAQRREREQLERNAEVVENRIKNTGTIGSDKPMHVTDKNRELRVTYDQMKSDSMVDGEPIIPVAVERRPDGGFDYVLTEPHYHAVKQGKVCGQCLEWQENPYSEGYCMWRGKKLQPLNGCGHYREINYDLGQFVKGKVVKPNGSPVKV